MDQVPPFRARLVSLIALYSVTTTTSVTLMTINALAGLELAPDPSLATVPVTAFVGGIALSTYAVSQVMGKLGRRTGFRVGAMVGASGGVLCAIAAQGGRFWLLVAGNLLLGTFAAAGQYARFAASEVVPPHLRKRAQSWVLAGGVVGAVVGPESASFTSDLLATRFVATFATLVGLTLLAMLVVTPLAAVPHEERRASGEPRAASRLLRLEVTVAIASAVVGFAVMVFLMTATPLAMRHHHHTFPDTARVIAWHVLGMYAPSFVTGSLITRFGAARIIATGVLLMVVCAGTNLLGTTLVHFQIALVVLGVGWNFMFMGGTVLLTEVCSPQERPRAEGLNDSLVYAANTLASLGAGVFVHRVGWQPMNFGALPLLLVIVVLLALLARRRASVTASFATVPGASNE